MGFSARQILALRRKLDARQIRTRESNGRELSYLEGWFVVSEANRIFGFDGWSRETVESRCVLAREIAAHLPRSISPKCASRFTPTAQRSFARAMAPVKAAERLPAKCTTSRLKPRKRMRPSAP